jgi:hypothetical protein
VTTTEEERNGSLAYACARRIEPKLEQFNKENNAQSELYVDFENDRLSLKVLSERRGGIPYMFKLRGMSEGQSDNDIYQEATGLILREMGAEKI